MKKPKMSSVGVLPMRSSVEIPGMKVILEGKSTSHKAEMDEIEMASRAQEDGETLPADIKAPSVPRLDLTEAVTIEVPDKVPEEPAEKKKQKPAILASVGTISSVTMTERAKPPPKPAVMQHTLHPMSRQQDYLDVRSSRKSTRSIQSSLLSDELHLPDETVYSKYDDAIATVDADTETVVGGGDKDTESPAMKSVKQLLEEAKKISSPGAEPLYQRHMKTPSGKSTSEAATEGRKSGRKRNCQRRDRKIQEIMERVMSRTGAAGLVDMEPQPELKIPALIPEEEEPFDAEGE
nr:hypothetical protein BaRGS_017979 [Batillaria attramentaria]